METTCCIVGGGPAGVVLGYLLARSGIQVAILEKHQDFYRDFRGDTIHPSTMDVLEELGLLDKFLNLRHDELRAAVLSVDGQRFDLADFSQLPTKAKFMAFIPQWDFLKFFTEEGKSFPGFRVLMEHEAVDLLIENGRTVGVVVETRTGKIEVRSPLVVAADGRHSILRDRAGIRSLVFGAPIDVLWMRIPKPASTPENTLGYVHKGRLMVLIDRGNYYQAGFLIPKDGFEAIKSRGLAAFRQALCDVIPFLAATVEEIDEWEKVKLLSVRIDRLERWYSEGLLFIGDAAHAMSPAGGVGINLAIQDAVAAANALAVPLHQGVLNIDHLKSVQVRRDRPTRVLQGMQVQLHKMIVNASARSSRRMLVALTILRLVPPLRRLVARFIGMGPLPEHVNSPNSP